MTRNIITSLLLLISLELFSNSSDTIKIKLEINGSTIQKPSRKILVVFWTNVAAYNSEFLNDLIVIPKIPSDTIAIVIVYKDEEIARCFKYSPGTLKDIKSLEIEIFTTRKAISQKLKDTMDTSIKYGKLKSMCILTTYMGTDCTCKNWTQ
ncbi:MAG: hypothetical protein ACK47E_12285 [Cyclobacteriaceae bacterium]